jgi:t-SNARE complex subunit (syntaxin)
VWPGSLVVEKSVGHGLEQRRQRAAQLRHLLAPHTGQNTIIINIIVFIIIIIIISLVCRTRSFVKLYAPLSLLYKA